MSPSEPTLNGNEYENSQWKRLFGIGGMAALIAGILFRRNIAAEITLFSNVPIPVNIHDWYVLLQSNRLLGLAYLNFFDIVNYSLLGLMFLSLYTALKHLNRSSMTIAITLGFIGIAVYFATNPAFSLLSLSGKYITATTELQRTSLHAAGEAVLAFRRSSNPGTGAYLSFFFIAVSGLITATVMLKSTSFRRITAYIGIVACTLDLIYCIIYPFSSLKQGEILALCFIPAAGLLLMIWHIMIGIRLIRMATTKERREEPKV